MELHEDLQTARTHTLTDELDEKLARVQMGLTVLYIGLAVVMTFIAIWLVDLEGTIR